MTLTNIGFLLIGVALVAIGYARARGPWSRYQALKEQQANVARYEAWRGGLRTQDEGPTGASVAIVEFRRQAILAAAIAVVGVVLVLLALVVR